MTRVDFSVLAGKTLTEIRNEDDGERLVFVVDDGSEYLLHHVQDCCESVSLEEIVGDPNDLIGTPILQAEEVSNDTDPAPDPSYTPESYTWTFYKMATIKGHVTFRWYGESNGYYSESVDFEQTKEPELGIVFKRVLSDIECGDFRFLLRYDDDRPYLQIECDDTCNVTGEANKWRGRKWFLSDHMTTGEIVQTALKATLTAVEHETREMFKYKGAAIYDPHYDIEKLVELRLQSHALKGREAHAA